MTADGEGAAALAEDPWASAAPPKDGEVVVFVIADIDDGTRNVWTLCWPKVDALRKVAARWAEDHKVPGEAVGFNGVRERNDLDLDLPLAEFVGSAAGPVELYAVPLDASLGGAEPSGPPHLPACAAQDQAVDAVPVGAALADAAPADMAQASDGASAVAASRADQERPPKKRARAAASPAGTDEPPPKRRGRTAAPAAASPEAERAQDQDETQQPQLDEPVLYLQDNPKKAGSAGWQRYEKYKRAKTPREALALGSASGDLKHDWKKGFYARAP